MKAYCSSAKCTNNHPSGKPTEKPGIKLGVKSCPDCTYSLIWVNDKLDLRRKSSNKNVRSIERKKTLTANNYI